MADAKNLIGLGIAGLAAWWAYKNFFVPSPGTPTTTPPAVPPATPVTTPPVPTPTPTSGGPCAAAGLLAPTLALAQAYDSTKQIGPNLPGTFNIDQWGYFLNEVCSNAENQFRLTADDLFPGDPNRGGPLNWSAWSGYAKAAGLSAPPRARSNYIRVRRRSTPATGHYVRAMR